MDSGTPDAERNSFPRPSFVRMMAIAAAVLLAGFFVRARSSTIEAIWAILTGHDIPVQGQPVAATHSKLSEHEQEYIEQQPPQRQAEMLLQAAINHDLGATNMIADKVDGWHGRIKNEKTLSDAEMTALYSNDLRVRAAAIEIELAAYDVAKTPDQVSQLIAAAEQDPKSRPWTEWVLGMIANRGVETERVREFLETYLHDSDQQTRFWAVEGLAHIGTDETIKDFLEVLHHDPSLDVRERGGCSLAKSGMMTREQRMKAVPGLIDMAGDPALDPTTRNWVYQALREITDESMPNDPGIWRNWYSAHGAERTQRFHNAGESAVLGNN